MEFSDLWEVAGCKRPQEDVVVGHFGFCYTPRRGPDGRCWMFITM